MNNIQKERIITAIHKLFRGKFLELKKNRYLSIAEATVIIFNRIEPQFVKVPRSNLALISFIHKLLYFNPVLVNDNIIVYYSMCTECMYGDSSSCSNYNIYLRTNCKTRTFLSI